MTLVETRVLIETIDDLLNQLGERWMTEDERVRFDGARDRFSRFQRNWNVDEPRGTGMRPACESCGNYLMPCDSTASGVHDRIVHEDGTLRSLERRTEMLELASYLHMRVTELEEYGDEQIETYRGMLARLRASRES